MRSRAAIPKAPAKGAAVFMAPAAADELEAPVALEAADEALEVAEATAPAMLEEALERAELAELAAEAAAPEAELAALERALEPEAATEEAEEAAEVAVDPAPPVVVPVPVVPAAPEAAFWQ